MKKISGKNTKPELIVRKFLFSKGFRFRKNVISLPGTPDIVLPKYKSVIFVNGCFWHGHEGCKRSHLPSSRVEFWKTKIESNISRDNKNLNDLKNMRWNPIIIWQCEMSSAIKRECRLNKLINELNRMIDCSH